jgi:hypothetical protein
MSASPQEFEAAALERWWRKISEGDLDDARTKAGEYGSADLQLMGAVLEALGWAPEGHGQEAAVHFYLLGKCARALGAYAEGRAPSEDTLHDETVYAMMARRLRQTGGWP